MIPGTCSAFLYELAFLCGLEKNVERAKLHMMHIVLHEELNIGEKLMVGLDVEQTSLWLI